MVQGAYADPGEVESLFHDHCKSWLGGLPAGVRSGLPPLDKLQVAVELLGRPGREGEKVAGTRARARLGPPEGSVQGGGSLSLSHGSGLCLAVRWNGASVGVDLERADRPVSEAVRMRVAAETLLPPLSLRLSAIQIWSLKEAAFKACPWNDGTTLAQYWLESWEADLRIARIGFPSAPDGLRTGAAWATIVEISGVHAAFAVGIVGMRS